MHGRICIRKYIRIYEVYDRKWKSQVYSVKRSYNFEMVPGFVVDLINNYHEIRDTCDVNRFLDLRN